MINVLVVDDSAFMRKALSIMLEKDDDIVVTGSARNGEEALTKIRELRPDVVTMDIEMPQMNGLETGTAYIGRGGDHLTLRRNGVGVFIELTDEPKELLYHPSADVLFSFISSIYGAAGLGLILTGMGRDGWLGLKELKQRGGWILSQNEKTSAVYGMPKAVNDVGLSDGIHSIDGIISSLKTMQSKPIMTPEGEVTHAG